jgi:hypothetical protein
MSNSLTLSPAQYCISMRRTRRWSTLTATEALSSRPIESYLLPSSSSSSSSSSSVPIVISDDENDETLLLQSSQLSTQSLRLSQSTTPPSPPRKMTAAMRKQRDADCAAAVDRHVLSDISNVNNSNFSSSRHVRHNHKKRSFYQSTRARLAHPDDNTMCAYCGKREHTALHHEDGFKRAGTAVSDSHPHTHSKPYGCDFPQSKARSDVRLCRSEYLPS